MIMKKVESEYFFYRYDQPTKILDLNIFHIAIYPAFNISPDFSHTESDKYFDMKEYDTASIHLK